MSREITVVPTGTANIASITAAFGRLGVEVVMADTSKDIARADQLVVPGVGAFGAAMGRIDQRGWRTALTARIEAGKPTLAVCLGMQLLCEKSDESVGVAGLGVVPATVTRFSENLTVPQLGWNRVESDPRSRFLQPGWAYFANSYRLHTAPAEWTAARTDYGGSFVSALERGNILACQFHPELSGQWGSNLLARWINGTGGGS